jgi:acyl-CoA thioester hydrolase
MTCITMSTTVYTTFCKPLRIPSLLLHVLTHASFDSVVNTYLVTQCSHSPTSSPQIGLVVHSHCDYFAPVEFPDVLDLALRVKKLGKSSVTYEISVFRRGDEEVKAVGEFVHVFVEREGRRPAEGGMSAALRRGLEQLILAEKEKL